MKFTEYEIETCIRAQFTLGILNEWSYTETLEHIKEEVERFIYAAKETNHD